MESLRPSEAELEILVIASCENSFSRFTRKRKVKELRLVISATANINSGIAVILSPKSSPYDLQKRSWNFLINCVVRKQFFAIYAKTEGARA